MQALRRLFYRNRSITDGDGRHFIKRENGIERALAGADGLAVMRVHAAAAMPEQVEHSTVRLGDEQLCGVGRPMYCSRWLVRGRSPDRISSPFSSYNVSNVASPSTV